VTATPRAESAIIAARAERRILLVRGYRVLLDSDLATLYEVPTRRLNEQVRRNLGSIPARLHVRLDA